MNKPEHRFLVLAVCSAFLLRIFRIGSQSLWVDEGLTLAYTFPTAGTTIWGNLLHIVQGPLHSGVVYACHFISMNDGWLRAPSSVAGAISVYFFYRWIDLWLSAKVARLATVLLVVHPLHVHYSQELRNYSFLFLFVSIACFLFHRLLGEERRRDWIFYVITIALAVLSNFTATFVFVTHTMIYFWRRGIRRASVRRWLLVGLAILVLISPWVYRIYTYIDVSALVTPVMPGQLSAEDRLRGETSVTLSALPYTAYVFSVGFSMGPSLRELHREYHLARVLASNAPAVLWVSAIFGLTALLGLIELARWGRRGAEVWLYLAIPIVLTLALCWQNAKVYNARYVLVSLPAFLCILAAGLGTLRTSRSVLLTSACLATLVFSLGNYYFNDRYAKEDIRGATRYLVGRLESGGCILAPQPITHIVEHYDTGRNLIHDIYLSRDDRKNEIDTQVAKLAGECATVWYVRSREWVVDPDGYLLEALQRSYRQTEVVGAFTGVTLIAYRRDDRDLVK